MNTIESFYIRPSLKHATVTQLLEYTDAADERLALEAENELALRNGGWFYFPHGGWLLIERIPA